MKIKTRLTAQHPFILSGSSTQILVPLLQQCLPIILPTKREELDAGNDEDEESEEGGGLKGTILAVDRNTYRVTDVVANEGNNQVNIQNQNVETVPIEKVLTKYQNMSITKNTVPCKLMLRTFLMFFSQENWAFYSQINQASQP